MLVIFVSGSLMARHRFLGAFYACSNQAHSVIRYCLYQILLGVHSSMVEQVAFNYSVGSSNLPGPNLLF